MPRSKSLKRKKPSSPAKGKTGSGSRKKQTRRGSKAPKHMDVQETVEEVLTEEPEVPLDQQEVPEHLREPRQPSLEPLYYYAAREHCRKHDYPGGVAAFAKHLRERVAALSERPNETAESRYYRGKQLIWEICHGGEEPDEGEGYGGEIDAYPEPEPEPEPTP